MFLFNLFRKWYSVSVLSQSPFQGKSFQSAAIFETPPGSYFGQD